MPTRRPISVIVHYSFLGGIDKNSYDRNVWEVG
jgi:hypothetical protein